MAAVLAGPPPCADPVECARLCDAGSGPACTEVAQDLRAGDDALALSLERGLLYARACDGGDDLSCRRMAAVQLSMGSDTGGAALVDRCGAGDLVACATVVVSPDQAGPRRVSAAAGVLAARCDADVFGACALTVLAWDRVGDPSRDAAAVALGKALASRCKGGDLVACGRRVELAGGRFALSGADLESVGVVDADLGASTAAFAPIVTGLPEDPADIVTWTRATGDEHLRACRAGDPWGCMSAWDVVASLRRSCPLGQGKACETWAASAWRDLCDARWVFGCRMDDVLDAPREMELRCARGEPSACFSAARAADLVSFTKGADAYRTACRAGDGAACFALADRVPAEAASVLPVACRHGYAPACVGPRPVPRAPPRPRFDVVTLGAACAGGDGLACRTAADGLGSRGFGYGFADSWGRLLLARTCAVDGRGCVSLAERYVDPLDGSWLPEATDVLVAGCDKGDLGSCIRLYEVQGEGKDKTAAKAAAELAKPRCVAGELRACALGIALDALWLGSASSAARKVPGYLGALEKACKAGDATSCDGRAFAAATGRLVPGALPADLETIGTRLPERLAAKGGLALQRPDKAAAARWRRTGVLARVEACGPHDPIACREALELDLASRCGDDLTACKADHREVWDGLCARGETATCDLAATLDALPAWREGCDKGRPEACAHVGRYQLLRAEAFSEPLTIGCDGDEAMACELLGYARTLGTVESRDAHERACVLGNETGCLAALPPEGGCADGLACAHACDAGDVEACGTHARQLAETDARAHHLMAAVYADSACAAEDAAGCRVLAGLLHAGRVPGAGDRSARATWETACTAGDLAACIELWNAVPSQGERALDTLVRHARAGCPADADLCVLGGFVAERHLGDVASAQGLRRALLERWDAACTDRDGAACWGLARALSGKALRVRLPDGTDADAWWALADADAAFALSEVAPETAMLATRRAGQAWSQDCRHDDPAACVELTRAATTLATSACVGPGRSCAALAASWWKKACAGGDVIACKLPSDADPEAWRAQCVGGDGRACFDLARWLKLSGKSGDGVFADGCRVGDPRACYGAALSAPDADRAHLLGEACAGGVRIACALTP